MKKILYILGGLIVFSFIVSKCSDSAETSATSDKVTVDTTSTTTTVAPETVKEEIWSYTEDVDKMTSAKKYYAQCLSTNRVEFDFPYNEDGGSSFVLMLRHDKSGNDVMLTVSKGQFIDGIGGEKTIRMKFDDEKPINVGVSGSSSGSADVLFLSPTSKIIAKLKKSKKIIIEPEFYEVGYKQVEFDTEGLVWNH